jgi:MarR family transcriptional regulator, organic hydroperoxide resistance regulator
MKGMKAEASAIRQMFRSRSLGSPENAVGFVLWRVVAHYQREADRSLASLDLTNLQFVTLALVAWFAQSNENVSQAELARFGGIQPMQMSLMLKALEGKGFIARPRSDVDSRAKQVLLTRGGLGVLREALPRMMHLQEELFGREGLPGGDLHTSLLQLDQKMQASDLG